jgi:hypothetical protein
MERPRTIRRVRMMNFADHYQAVGCSWWDDWDFAVSMRYSKLCGFIAGMRHAKAEIELIKEMAYDRGVLSGISFGNLMEI